MYTRIALGKDSSMDVVAGETVVSDGQVKIIYPMLFTLQVRRGRGVDGHYG